MGRHFENFGLWGLFSIFSGYPKNTFYSFFVWFFLTFVWFWSIFVKKGVNVVHGKATYFKQSRILMTLILSNTLITVWHQELYYLNCERKIVLEKIRQIFLKIKHREPSVRIISRHILEVIKLLVIAYFSNHKMIGRKDSSFNLNK